MGEARGIIPSPSSTGPGVFAVLMWRDGTPADEEFVAVPAPLTVEGP